MFIIAWLKTLTVLFLEILSSIVALLMVFGLVIIGWIFVWRFFLIRFKFVEELLSINNIMIDQQKKQDHNQDDCPDHEDIGNHHHNHHDEDLSSALMDNNQENYNTTTTTNHYNDNRIKNGMIDDTGKKCNLTLVLKEKMHLELEQRPHPPRPGPNEVSLATHTVGICGSDVKYWQHGHIGPFVLKKPMILGHETSAIVMEVGQNVKLLKPGDRVAVEVGLPCKNCSKCRSGRYNLCSEMAFAATPPYDGTLTRYFNHPADFCYKLPDKVSLEEGALLEPLSVAVHACQRASIKLGDVVLVCGAGAVGLVSMLAAKAFGASYVIITDVLENRLKFAKEMGANGTILIKRGQTPKDLSEMVRKMANELRPNSDGVDVVLECSGAESSLNLAIQATCVGGQIICIGCQPDTVNIQLSAAIMQEIDIKTVFRYKNCYPIGMNLVETGKINLKPLITHRYSLEKSVEAFEACARGEGVKIIISCMADKPLQTMNNDNITSKEPRSQPLNQK